MSEWSFTDPPNLAVIVDRSVVEGRDWVACVYHDADDGTWQFRASAAVPTNEADVMLIGLRSAAKIDPTVVELANLPVGWRAWRDTKDSEWHRAKT